MDRYKIQVLRNLDGPCQHTWIVIGGRECPVNVNDCSQKVYQCKICRVYDYGYKDGPAFLECSKCYYFKEFNKNAPEIRGIKLLNQL